MGVKVGVQGSPRDLNLVEVKKRSSVGFYEGWPTEGVAWRSPPNITAAWGRSFASVMLIHCSVSLCVLLH